MCLTKAHNGYVFKFIIDEISGYEAIFPPLKVGKNKLYVGPNSELAVLTATEPGLSTIYSLSFAILPSEPNDLSLLT